MVSFKQGFELLSTAITSIKNSIIEANGFSENMDKALSSIANSFHPRWDIIGSIIKKKGDIKYAFFPIPEHNYLGFDDIPANLSELKLKQRWTDTDTCVRRQAWR